jgi:hypothetical protein
LVKRVPAPVHLKKLRAGSTQGTYLDHPLSAAATLLFRALEGRAGANHDRPAPHLNRPQRERALRFDDLIDPLLGTHGRCSWLTSLENSKPPLEVRFDPIEKDAAKFIADSAISLTNLPAI